MYKLKKNKDVLITVIRDYIAAEKKMYLEKNSRQVIGFNDHDIEIIASVLCDQMDDWSISVQDIDKAVDTYLKNIGYVYDNEITKQYVKRAEENYYYYGLAELNITGSARSISEAMYLISKEIDSNLKTIAKIAEASDKKTITINIVKDNSTKFFKDNAVRIMSGHYDSQTGEVGVKFEVQDIKNVFSGNAL